jgi:hypothetical protein
MLYWLVTAMYPQFLITLDENDEEQDVTVRVGQAVNTVGLAGTRSGISGVSVFFSFPFLVYFPFFPSSYCTYSSINVTPPRLYPTSSQLRYIPYSTYADSSSKRTKPLSESLLVTELNLVRTSSSHTNLSLRDW